MMAMSLEKSGILVGDGTAETEKSANGCLR